MLEHQLFMIFLNTFQYIHLKVVPDKKFHIVTQTFNIYNHDDLDATSLVLQYDKDTKEAQKKKSIQKPSPMLANSAHGWNRLPKEPLQMK